MLKFTNYGYLEKTPTKKDILEAAVLPGNIRILNNSNNRALVIDTKFYEFLQSYNTIVCIYDKRNKTIIKRWNGYSVTTMKHINEFLYAHGLQALSKKEWLALPTSDKLTNEESMMYMNSRREE